LERGSQNIEVTWTRRVPTAFSPALGTLATKSMTSASAFRCALSDIRLGKYAGQDE